jgi:outer membrane protein TolC
MPKIELYGSYEKLDRVPTGNLVGQTIPLADIDDRSVDLVLVQPLDVYGINRLNLSASKAGRSAYACDSVRQINDTTLDTKTAFYNVLRAQSYLAVQVEMIALLEAHLKEAQINLAAGTVSRFDVLRAETQLANAQQGLISARNGVELSKAAFNEILGRPLDTPVELAEPDQPDDFDFKPEDCVRCACESRPEVLRSDQQIERNAKLLKACELSSKPRFAFRLDYNRNFDPAFYDPAESSLSAFLTVSAPFYDGGDSKASIQKAQSDLDAARITREQTLFSVTLDTRQSYLDLKESRERVKASRKMLDMAREGMRLAQVRYKAALSTQVEVLDAQTELKQVETGYVNDLYGSRIALARLERSVGGEAQMAKLIHQSR